MVYGFALLAGVVIVLAIDTILRDRRRTDEVIAAVRGYSEQEQRRLDDIVGALQKVGNAMTLLYESLEKAKKPVKRGK